MMGKNGALIISDLTKAMKKKIKDPTNLTYLQSACDALKHILRLWFKLMVVMKSKQRQSNNKIKKSKRTQSHSTKKFIP